MSDQKPSSLIVNISRARYSSPNYHTTPRTHGVVCRPLIINIQSTAFGRYRKISRGSTTSDVELLEQTFSFLDGFTKPEVISTDTPNSEGTLSDLPKFRQKLRDIACDPAFTTNVEVFVCVVLAYGNPGFFYLANENGNREPSKMSVDELMSYFKGNNCPCLLLKPKIFIVQTCDVKLEKKDRSLFTHEDSPTTIDNRHPVEADILLYHSVISGAYTEEKDKAKRLAKEFEGLVDQKDEKPACQFVYTLYNEVCKLYNEVHKHPEKERQLSLTDLIYSVNNSLQQFIDSKIWESDEVDKPWTTDPQIPTCIDQLTRDLHLSIQT